MKLSLYKINLYDHLQLFLSSAGFNQGFCSMRLNSEYHRQIMFALKITLFNIRCPFKSERDLLQKIYTKEYRKR